LASENPGKAKELHQKLKSWRRRINAPVPTQANPKYDAAAESSAIKTLQIKKDKKSGNGRKS
ncbi:MAG: aryl-sulfate sulfohydrolase, partial [Planctomycetota bacterium]